MKTCKLTTAAALVKYLVAQKIRVNDKTEQLFGCIFAIFGHGNVTCLGQQLKHVEEIIPTWRGQNEQSMALAATAFAKANQRRRMGIATSSIGPGSTNMVTAAGVAHANRLPLLLLSGDTFVSRLPDPVLQQVEHFYNPTITVTDAFKAVTRYWDRITAPGQLLESLPQAINVLLDPADCGPAFIGLPQDVQGFTYDFPELFFEDSIHEMRRPEPEPARVNEALQLIRAADRPLIICGGGIHYAQATETLATFAGQHRIPVVETTAGRAALLQSHPLNAGPIGITGSDSANYLAAKADLILAVGTRLQDFTTGSWTVFRNPDMRLVSINVARFDAVKHRSLAVIGDAGITLQKLDVITGDWQAPAGWAAQARTRTEEWKRIVRARTEPAAVGPVTYAQVVGAVNRLIEPGDSVVTAAGGLPGELNMNWQSNQIGKFDIEYGFSCMGYEIAGGWGIRMANPDHDVIVLVGDGSYLMMNSDVYSSVMTGHKMIVIVCDNGGFAVIERLQVNTGNDSFNNQFKDCRRLGTEVPKVDFVRHAEAQGAVSEKVESIAEFDAAFARAKSADRTYVIVIETDPAAWSECDCWWEVGLPEETDSGTTVEVVDDWKQGKRHQRRGI